ncbi:IPT/TIG domain-containing protein [Streptomyces sp. NRRL WC-3742]|uniref:IPT/TIG domain-containing protein n=1 Tax=Streptomyces sp. NRRL WC-3742 TaxID=1463934 RepID=UPI002D21DE54|nr:IPT/TIG domain-containing protein [Streptomyces sp. NRRL WC-3742]
MVTGVNPTSGPARTTTVTITGSGFPRNAGVNFKDQRSWLATTYPPAIPSVRAVNIAMSQLSRVRPSRVGRTASRCGSASGGFRAAMPRRAPSARRWSVRRREAGGARGPGPRATSVRTGGGRGGKRRLALGGRPSGRLRPGTGRRPSRRRG